MSTGSGSQLIVIGSSAGGIEALSRLVSGLPADLVGRLAERDVVGTVATDIVALLGPHELELTDDIRTRYPGW